MIEVQLTPLGRVNTTPSLALSIRNATRLPIIKAMEIARGLKNKERVALDSRLANELDRTLFSYTSTQERLEEMMKERNKEIEFKRKKFALLQPTLDAALAGDPDAALYFCKLFKELDLNFYGVPCG